MGKPKTITIDDVEYVRKDSVKSVPEINTEHFVIVRCRNAGVHAGTLEYRDSDILVLKNSRRLWRWWSKFSLSGLAMDGPLKGKESEQAYACVLPELTLTTSDVCEVIPCTKEAVEKIMSVPDKENS